MSFKTADQQLTDQIALFQDDPLGYVMWAFPWGTDENIQQVPLQEPYRTKYNLEFGPDVWACEFLEEWGNEIKKRKFNGRDAVAPIQFSTASGHGIGKSTIVAWIILFILDTRPFSMGVVTANTSDQLRTKTWAELAKWHHRAITSHFWDYVNSRGNMSLSRRDEKAVKQKWRCDAMTARAENAESFQGLHAANSTPFYIFDEASGIEDKIWEARFGGATDGEPMTFDFGNPTRKAGWFYRNTVGDMKERFLTRSIDSRTCHIPNKALIEQWKEDWGEDSNLFKVKVRGMFPSVASMQFIDNNLVEGAARRIVIPDKSDPVAIGVDVARFGDNNTVIFTRIGMDARSIPPMRYNGLDTMQVVDKVIEAVRVIQGLGKRVGGLFIDGGGLGAGVVDRLRQLGYNPIDVNAGRTASDKRFGLWGDMMWGKMREALNRLAIPNDDELKTQLTQRQYDVPQGKIRLETKKDMKLDGRMSPDDADALALTFASDLASDHANNQFGNPVDQVKSDFDPFGDEAWSR